MESNQVSLTRMMLNIATPSDQGISFSRGEILQGTVQEVRNDGLVVMLLKGRLIEAATEVMVKSGQQLFLMVDDFREGKTYLKVLSPERMERVENANLSANLQNMGIPAREDTVVMARKLLQHNLPVTPNNLNEMAKGVNFLGGTSQKNLEVIAFALSRSLPLNEQVLSALLQFTDPESDLSRLLKTLAQSLTQLPRPVIGGSSEQAARLSADIPRSPGGQAISSNNQDNNAAGRSQTLSTGARNNEPALNNPAVSRSVTVDNTQPQKNVTEAGRVTLQTMQSLANREVPVPGESQPRMGSGQQQVVPERPAGTVIVTPADGDDNPLTGINRTGAERPGQITTLERSVTPGISSAQTNGEKGSPINQLTAERVGPQMVPEQVASQVTGAPADGDEIPGSAFNGLNAEKVSLQGVSQQLLPELNPDNASLAGGDKMGSILPELKNSGEILKFLELIRPLLDVLQLEANDKPAVMGERMQTLLQSEKDIIRGLILLEDIIKNAAAGSKSPPVTELLSRVEGMEKELSGQRIFNYLSRMPDSNFNYYYFSFPVKINNDYRLCQLRVNREAGKKILKDQDNIKFIVSLDTAKMGMVLFHINWNRNKTLTVQGVVEAEKVMNHLNQNIGQLINGLGQLGYSVTNLGIRVARKDEHLDKLKPQMEEVPMKFRPFSIDVTV